MPLAIVKAAENLPTLSEGGVSNVYVDTSGRLHVAPAAGGGSGGDVSAAKQDEQFVYLESIDDKYCH